MLQRFCRSLYSDKGHLRPAEVDGLTHKLPSSRNPIQPITPTSSALPSVAEAVRSNGIKNQGRQDDGSSGTYVSQRARQSLFSNAQEQVTELEGAIVGKMPAWLQGSLIINGGAAYDPAMTHLFDGYGMMVKLRVDAQQRVWGMQRYVQTKAHKHFAETGAMRWREFGSPAKSASLFLDVARFMETGMSLALGRDAFTDNASVNLIPLPDGTLLASSETILAQYRVDPQTLDTLSPVRIHERDGALGNMTSAHPKRMADGTLVNFTHSFPNGGFHVFKQDPATLKRTIIANIPDRQPMHPAWVHDLACSEHFLVLSETPLLMNLASLVLGYDTPYVFMDWKPELGTRVHVVALDGSGVRSYDTPAWFAFHFANAHEAIGADGKPVVHLDMSLYPTPEVLNGLRLDRLKAFPGDDVPVSSLHRLTIPLDAAAPAASSAGGGAETRLGFPQQLVQPGSEVATFFDFPAVAPSRVSRSYRYVYGTTAVRPTNMGNALVKVDVTDGTSKVFHEPGGLAGEPLFVPRPGGTAEDDGVVLSPLTMANGRSALLVLDAQTFTETARAVMPFVVPYRFHGVWLPA